MQSKYIVVNFFCGAEKSLLIFGSLKNRANPQLRVYCVYFQKKTGQTSPQKLYLLCSRCLILVFNFDKLGDLKTTSFCLCQGNLKTSFPFQKPVQGLNLKPQD